jgi:hypothetical protein
MNSIGKIAKGVLPHFIPALFIGAIGAWATGDRALLVVGLLTGWLIDADHSFDFMVGCFLRREDGPFLNQVATGSYFKRTGKVYVLLHSWELIGVWMVAWALAGRRDFAIVGGFAWALHLGIDHLTYRLHPLAYFLTYRVMHRFELSQVCR